MASKTPKAPKKATAKAKPAPSRPKKAAKPAKGKGRGQAAVVFEETQQAAPAEAGPSFFERLRQRRAERHAARADEWRRRQAERHEQLERERQAEEEQRKLREAAEKAEQERLAAEEKARQEEAAAAERKAKAAARREAQRAEKDAEEARKAEAAIALAAAEAEKEKAEQEAKARRAAEREAKRRELEEEERRKAEEQARRDAEEAAERESEERRLAAQERMRREREAAEEAKAKAKPKELEPEMEFQEASKPVAAGREMVPKDGVVATGASSGASAVDVQADLMVAELARRRSKPIVLEEELPAPPTIPKAPLRPGETWSPPPPQPKPEVEFIETEAPAPAPSEAFGFTLPEAFLLLANGGQWDERAERNKEGAYGGALAGALVLELLMARALQVQRDRFVPTGTVPDDPALYAALERLRRIREKKGDVSSLRQMAELAKANRDLLRPYKDSLQMRALARWGERKHLGLFHRSWLQVTDLDVQERLQNRLRRAIAGGGTPEPQSILLLGLLDAVGQFGTVVPDEAADYNRKRLNGLLGGRDIMGYKVHPDLKALQEIAVRTVLANVRLMTTRG